MARESRSGTSGTRSTPDWSNAAVQATSLPVSDPVWERVAASASSDRPTFTTRTGVPERVASSATRTNQRGSSTPSTYAQTTSTSGRSAIQST